MKKLYALIAGLTTLISCQPISKSTGDLVIEFQPDTVTSTVPFSISEVKYVPLEVTKNSLVGKIGKILYQNGHFYIFDKANMGVLLFNEEGKFEKALYKLGEGPGEYIYPIDFDVDETGDIYIADNAQEKIIKYAADDFNQYKDFNLGCYFMEFAVIDDKHIALADVYGKDGISDKLSIYSTEDQKSVPLLKPAFTSINELDILKTSSNYLFRSGRELYYYPRFTPYIYSIKGKDAISFAKVSSERYFKEEDLVQFTKKPQLFMADKKHIKDINSFYRTTDGYLCSLSTFPIPEFYWIPMTGSNIQKLDMMEEDKLLGNLAIHGVAGDYFICYSNYNEETAKSALKISNLKENERQMFTGWNEDSNPILILFKINRQ